MLSPSLRGANGSRECAPDDRLRDEAIQLSLLGLDCFAALAMMVVQDAGHAQKKPRPAGGPDEALMSETPLRLSGPSAQVQLNVTRSPERYGESAVRPARRGR